MTRFITGRLIGTLPVLFGVTLLVFLLLKFVPGDPVAALLGADAQGLSAAQLDKLLLDARRSADQAKRLALYQDAQQQIQKDLPMHTLYYGLTAYAKTNRLQGEDWRYSWINLDLSKASLK